MGSDRLLEASSMVNISTLDLLDRIDFIRIDASRRLDSRRKAELGQFFSSSPLARLMASMIESNDQQVKILDAGAGIGSLFGAAVAHFIGSPNPPRSIHVTAYEIDATLIPYLDVTLELCRHACKDAGIAFSSTIKTEDFIQSAVDALKPSLFSHDPRETYQYAILNPPYRKLNSDSVERKLLSLVGIHASNLYSAFLSLATWLLEPSGQLA